MWPWPTSFLADCDPLDRSIPQATHRSADISAIRQQQNAAATLEFQMDTAANRQAILQALDTLPPLHEVAQKLIALMSDDRSSATDLDRLISNDQALTARILKAANSSAYGKSRDIFSLTEAVVLLGHTTISNMVMSVAVADVVAGGQRREFAANAWQHSLACAALAQGLAKLTGSVEPEKAFVAGLLHDIGLLVQDQALPDVLQGVITAAPDDPLAAERQVMGLNHTQVGLKLLDRWLLPPSLCEAVRFHHAPHRKYQRTNPLVNIVALADRLSAVSGASVYPLQAGQDIFRLMRDVGLQEDQYTQIFAVLRKSHRDTHGLLEQAHLSDTPDDETAIPATMAIFASDTRRRKWYTAVLEHIGQPVADLQDVISGKTADTPVEHILVDFHGATPEHRQALDNAIRQSGLPPIVAGDIRHTPREARWQDAPHIPELFSQENLLEALSSAKTFVA